MLSLFFYNSDEMSKKVKARDQYGTVLTLPRGMKPHVKSTATTAESTTEATGMFNYAPLNSRTILFSF